MEVFSHGSGSDGALSLLWQTVGVIGSTDGNGSVGRSRSNCLTAETGFGFFGVGWWRIWIALPCLVFLTRLGVVPDAVDLSLFVALIAATHKALCGELIQAPRCVKRRRLCRRSAFL